MGNTSHIPVSRSSPGSIVGATQFSYGYALLEPTYNNGSYGTFPGTFNNLVRGFDPTLGTLRSVHLDLTVTGVIHDILQNSGPTQADFYLGPWSGNPNQPLTTASAYIGDATQVYLLQSATVTLPTTHIAVPPKSDGFMSVSASYTQMDTTGLTDPQWLSYFTTPPGAFPSVPLRFLVHIDAYVQQVNGTNTGDIDTHFTGILLTIRYEYQ